MICVILTNYNIQSCDKTYVSAVLVILLVPFTKYFLLYSVSMSFVGKFLIRYKGIDWCELEFTYIIQHGWMYHLIQIIY